MMVTNLLVLVTYLYQVMRKEESMDIDLSYDYPSEEPSTGASRTGPLTSTALFDATFTYPSSNASNSAQHSL